MDSPAILGTYSGWVCRRGADFEARVRRGQLLAPDRFLSAVFLAISMVFTRKLTAREPPARILFYYFLLSFLCGLPLMWLHWRPIPFSALPGLLFIGLSIYVALVFIPRPISWPELAWCPLELHRGGVCRDMGWLIWGHVPDLLALTGIGLVALGGLATLLLSQPSGSGSAVK